MYAETGLMFPYLQSFSQEVQEFDDFYYSQKTNASLGLTDNFLEASDYNLGGEGDLFSAPQPIIEEPDPVIAAMVSMVSCGEDVMPSQSVTLSDIESSGQLLSDVFYECKKDILAKEANEAPLSEVFNIKLPDMKTDENLIAEEKSLLEGPLQKSASSSCLTSMEWMMPEEAPLRPSFVDFPAMDLGTFYGMRRAFSEGDIKALGDNARLTQQSPMVEPKIMGTCTPEARQEKLSRYRTKKAQRNFGRKIKYACRKALADSQPRIRGRFAKTEEIDTSKKQ